MKNPEAPRNSTYRPVQILEASSASPRSSKKCKGSRPPIGGCVRQIHPGGSSRPGHLCRRPSMKTEHAIVVGLLLAAPAAANAQGHVRPGLPNPPGDCGIVVHEKSRNPVARMPDGRVVMLKDKAKVVFHRADAGHLHACWNEPERGGSR